MHQLTFQPDNRPAKLPNCDYFSRYRKRIGFDALRLRLNAFAAVPANYSDSLSLPRVLNLLLRETHRVEWGMGNCIPLLLHRTAICSYSAPSPPSTFDFTSSLARFLLLRLLILYWPKISSTTARRQREAQKKTGWRPLHCRRRSPSPSSSSTTSHSHTASMSKPWSCYYYYYYYYGTSRPPSVASC